jgi:hypothetical protein
MFKKCKDLINIACLKERKPVRSMLNEVVNVDSCFTAIPDSLFPHLHYRARGDRAAIVPRVLVFRGRSDQSKGKVTDYIKLARCYQPHL